MSYNFIGIIAGEQVLNKEFKSREKANKYLEKVLTEHNLEVNEVVNTRGDKHLIEFVCNDYNRFKINRI